MKRDGTVIHVETSSHAVAFAGRPGEFVIVLDVTERERVQRQLYQKQRLESLGELAGGVAHDFNNLLAVIMNYTAFARKELRSPEGPPKGARLNSVDDDLEQVERAAERGARLTHQLLAFARSEMVRTEALDLNEVVEGVEQLLRRTIGEHVPLVYQLEVGLWPVVADRGQLEQVLVNLAVNARDAMPGGGTVTVETGNVEVDEDYAATQDGLIPGPYVRLRVSDTGEGMDEEVQHHAFEPFFTTKPKGVGTGLGLATVHGIVAQRGHASIYSEPGLGTTFTALFPAVQEERPDHPKVGPPARRVGRGETVLVVDDEPAIREVARRILAHNGYEVIVAPDGAAAIALAQAHEGPIHLLLTDVVMPQMSGPELSAEMRVARPGLPVLYMSGYAPPVLGSREEIDAEGLLVEKPFSELVLLDKVREVLDRRE
ncbi:MAG: response regulator [Actinomycetota bacterium]|nr:response regulator [Actinomycetota bacterium]